MFDEEDDSDTRTGGPPADPDTPDDPYADDTTAVDLG
jgi:hypothetical protein